MKKNYRHLSAEERAVIMIEYGKDTSVCAIARLLGRSASTVSRELARNRDGSSPSYDATRAASAYRTRRERCVRRRKLAAGTTLYQRVHDHLVYWRWSPQRIRPRIPAVANAADFAETQVPWGKWSLAARKCADVVTVARMVRATAGLPPRRFPSVAVEAQGVVVFDLEVPMADAVLGVGELLPPAV